ncbi:hypothetical protein Q5752_006413 [Cryptotrichosporon argae]
MKGIFTLRRSQRSRAASACPLPTPPPSCPASPGVDTAPVCVRATTGPTQLRSVLPSKKNSGDSPSRRRPNSRSASAELDVQFDVVSSTFAPSPALSYCSLMTDDTAVPSRSPSPLSSPTPRAQAVLESPLIQAVAWSMPPPLPLAIPGRAPLFGDATYSTSPLTSSSVGSSFAGDRTPISPAFQFGHVRRASVVSLAQSVLNFADDDLGLDPERRTSADGLDVFGLSLASDDATCPSPLPHHLRTLRPASPRSPRAPKAQPARRRSSISLASSSLSHSPSFRAPHSPRIAFTSPFQPSAPAPSMSLGLAPHDTFLITHRSESNPLPPSRALPSALRGSRTKARSPAPLDVAAARRKPGQSDQEPRRSVRFV